MLPKDNKWLVALSEAFYEDGGQYNCRGYKALDLLAMKTDNTQACHRAKAITTAYLHLLKSNITNQPKLTQSICKLAARYAHSGMWVEWEI